MNQSAQQGTRARATSRVHSVAFIWGWLRKRFREWDRGRRNFVRGTVVGALLVSLVVAGFLLISPRLSGADEGGFATVALNFQPSALLGSHGQLYVGGEAGDLAAVDPDSRRVTHWVNVEHPVDHLAAFGDAVLAAGEEALTRVSPDLSGARTVHLSVGRRPFNIQSLAAGLSGVWLIGAGGRYLAHLSGSMLNIDAAVELPAVATTVVASDIGAWVLPETGHRLFFARQTGSSWRITPISLGCRPTSIAAEHDHAYVVCGYARRLLVITDMHLQILSSHRLGAQAQAIGLGNSSEWVLESSTDQVRQYAEATGREVGNPIGVGPEADSLAVYERAVWIAERDGTVTRIGMQDLAEARRAARRDDLPLFGTDHRPEFELADLMLIFATVALLVVLARGANSPFPRYFPSRQIVVLAINRALHDSIAGSLITGHVKKTTSGGAAGPHPLHLVGSHEIDTYFGAEPLDAAVGRTVRCLHRDDRLFTGVHFVPGFRHRGLRWRPAPDPSEQTLLRAWQSVANEGALCLIAGQEWLIGDCEVGAGRTLELDYVIDRIAGEWRRITAPAGARFRVVVAPGATSDIGCGRLRVGTRVCMDVLAQALPYDGSAQPQLELVAAWQPVRRPTPRGREQRKEALGDA